MDRATVSLGYLGTKLKIVRLWCHIDTAHGRALAASICDFLLNEMRVTVVLLIEPTLSLETLPND